MSINKEIDDISEALSSNPTGYSDEKYNAVEAFTAACSPLKDQIKEFDEEHRDDPYFSFWRSFMAMVEVLLDLYARR